MKKSSLHPSNPNRRRIRFSDNKIVIHDNELSYMLKDQPEHKEIPFVPISNYEWYIEEMILVDTKRLMAMDITEKKRQTLIDEMYKKTESIRSKHLEYHRNNQPLLSPPTSEPYRRDILTKLLVTKTGEVKLKMAYPKELLRKKYKNKRIPHNELVKVYKVLGYPDDFIAKLDKAEAQYVADEKYREEVFNRVFGKYAKKPTKKNKE